MEGTLTIKVRNRQRQHLDGLLTQSRVAFHEPGIVRICLAGQHARTRQGSPECQRIRSVHRADIADRVDLERTQQCQEKTPRVEDHGSSPGIGSAARRRAG
jgi:hypothetical protein